MQNGAGAIPRNEAKVNVANFNYVQSVGELRGGAIPLISKMTKMCPPC